MRNLGIHVLLLCLGFSVKQGEFFRKYKYNFQEWTLSPNDYKNLRYNYSELPIIDEVLKVYMLYILLAFCFY